MVLGVTPRRLGIAAALVGVLLLAGVAVAIGRRGDRTQQVSSSGSEVVTSLTSATTSAPLPVISSPSTTIAAPPSSTTTSLAPTTATSAGPSTAPPPTRPAGEQLETLKGGHAPVAAALADARARWAQSKPARGYTWSYNDVCFCYPRKLEVDVDGTGTVTATRALEGPTGPMTKAGLTVETAFAELQQAVDADVDRMTVRFDPRLGHPTSYLVDPTRRGADEEHGLTLIAFSPRS